MNYDCRLIILSLCALMTCATAQADLYSWKDSHGKIYYSDRPPLDAEQKVANEAGGKGSKNTPSTDKRDDAATTQLREEAKKQKILDNDKKLIKWRCVELDKEYQALLASYAELAQTDVNKAAALKVEAENHKDTIEKLCN